jgi:hypothetical protein
MHGTTAQIIVLAASTRATEPPRPGAERNRIDLGNITDFPREMSPATPYPHEGALPADDYPQTSETIRRAINAARLERLAAPFTELVISPRAIAHMEAASPADSRDQPSSNSWRPIAPTTTGRSGPNRALATNMIVSCRPANRRTHSRP